MAEALVEDSFIYLLAFSLVFNLLLGLVLLHLRRASEGFHMTLSQRWGLTLLGWLNIVNALQIAAVIGERLAVLAQDQGLYYLFYRVEQDLSMVTLLFLLSFGLIYPRPVVKWERLRFILVSLVLIFLVAMPFQTYLLVPQGAVEFDVPSPMMMLLALPANFIPIFLWLPEYDRQNSPHMRMLLTVLIWGYLFVQISYNAGAAFRNFLDGETFRYGVIIILLAMMVFIILGRAMYRRRGHWATAEWANIVFIVLAFTFAGLYSQIDAIRELMGIGKYNDDPLLSMLVFLTTIAGWAIVRPTLFFYGPLRYQLFPQEIGANRAFALLFSTVAACAAFMAPISIMGRSDLGVALGLGVALALVTYFLSKRLFEDAVRRVMPMSGGGSGVLLAERRATYLAALQSSIVKGAFGDPSDVETLNALRKVMRVSEREHDLLMSGFSRERPLLTEGEAQVQEVYLFHMDGNLIASARRDSEGKKGSPEGSSKEDMITTMFTALGEFSKDALKAGEGHLDAIEYGLETLIIEVEGLLALGVMVRGKDNPQVRQAMRDLLRELHERYADVLKATDSRDRTRESGIEDGFQDIDGLLKGLLKMGEPVVEGGGP